MNAVGLAFLAIAATLMIVLPRRYASLPLIASAAYMTGGQLLDIAGANFTVPRLLIAVAVIRVFARGEKIAGGMQTVDVLVLLWALVLLGTSTFHTDEAWLYRAGIVWTELGCYLLFRVFLSGEEDLVGAYKFICVALLPVALLMLLEKSSGHNPFALLGGVNEYSAIRDGQIRASGPFAHPILAGTVGATSVALGCAMWLRSRRWAIAGWLSGLAMVYASTSSGPVMMLFFFTAAMVFWPLRRHMAAVRILLISGLFALDALMKDPVYFLMARIDISGGSQGYYRSQLIRSSIQHFSEWWAAGTDYTRHWMSSQTISSRWASWAESSCYACWCSSSASVSVMLDGPCSPLARILLRTGFRYGLWVRFCSLTQ
jgi:hypothetical protein